MAESGQRGAREIDRPDHRYQALPGKRGAFHHSRRTTHVIGLAKLLPIHQDPFDRILVDKQPAKFASLPAATESP